jgi:pimeloyl-ACP methyl ester carboxylesterase
MPYLRQGLCRKKHGQTSFLRGGKGEPILLLHGIPGSAYSWEAVGLQLAPHCTSVIPDLLGFGESDAPEGDYYMEAQAIAVKQLLDSLGISSLFLGGHDFGGPVALTLMRMFPELNIRGLVLSSTNTFTDTYIPPPLRVASVPAVGTLLFRALAGNRLGLGLMYYAATRQKSTASRAMFRRHMTPSGIDYTRRIFQRSLADLKGNYQAIESLLPHITRETLILWGDSDPFFGTSVGERMQRSIPGSLLKVYDHTGHFVPEEQPTRVADDIVRFLRHEGR